MSIKDTLEAIKSAKAASLFLPTSEPPKGPFHIPLQKGINIPVADLRELAEAYEKTQLGSLVVFNPETEDQTIAWIDKCRKCGKTDVCIQQTTEEWRRSGIDPKSLPNYCWKCVILR